VNYYIKKLVELGYLRKVFRSSQGNVYSLTPEGRKLLLELHAHHYRDAGVKISSGGMRLRVRVHGVRFVFPVLRRGVFGWDRGWVVRNWEKRYSDFGNVSVEETPGKIILHVKEVRDVNVWRAVYNAFRIALVFGNYFQRVTGYRLGLPEFDDKNMQVAIENDPLAAALLSVSNARIRYREGDRGIGADASHNRPELEFYGPNAPLDASRYLHMPDQIDMILERLSNLEVTQAKVVQALDKITRVFEDLFSGLDKIQDQSRKDKGERFYG